jgi:hypothetical protein
MVQLNLLPDVKLEYIKTKRTKRLVLGISLIVIGASVGLFVLMFSFVSIAQKNHIKKVEKDTDRYISEIQNTPGVNEILTVQNQLNVVNTKHTEKPAAIRVLPYIYQVLPTGTKINTLTADFKASTITLDGVTTDINAVNKIVDSFKFAKYKSESGTEGTPFSEVVLDGYSTDKSETSFSVTMKFDPIIFNNVEKVTITIPNQETTRSYTEKPVLEFSKPATPLEENNGQ